MCDWAVEYEVLRNDDMREVAKQCYDAGWEDRKNFDISLLKSMPSYWVDRMIRTIKNKL
jgi:hypothetical protein